MPERFEPTEQHQQIRTTIMFPEKLNSAELRNMDVEAAEDKMREYVSALLNEVCEKLGFSHLNLNSPLILFNGRASVGAGIHYKPDCFTGNLFYTVDIDLGLDKEETAEAIAEVEACLDYLVMHEFGHPLIGDGYVSPNFTEGIHLDKDRYKIDIPPAPTPNIDFTDDYEYGLGECAIDKFAFEMGGERTKEAYLAYSKRLLAETGGEKTPRAFCLLINHTAVLQILGEDGLAGKFIEKIIGDFSDQAYYRKFNEILETYKSYYEESVVQMKEKE